MWKKTVLLGVLACVIVAAGFACKVKLEQRQLADKMIRLHVVANSDLKQDQEQKLRVRDAVLEKVQALTKDAKTVRQAAQVLRSNLTLLAQTADSVLAKDGAGSNAAVSLRREAFPTRYYDSFTLPAGEYLSLRVGLGEQAGHNWWCVVFPGLCTAATTEDFYRTAEAGSFTEAETDYISKGEQGYVLKFKTLEYLQKLFDWLG